MALDSQGDSAILWTREALAGITHNSPTQFSAIRCSAGSTWGPQEIVAHNQWAAFDDAVLADNGDLIVAGHAYGLTCGKRLCTETNGVLYVSLEMQAPLTGFRITRCTASLRN